MPAGVTGRLPAHGDGLQCRTTKHRSDDHSAVLLANIKIGKKGREVTSISRILMFLLPLAAIFVLLALAAEAQWHISLAFQSLSLPHVTMDVINGISHNVSTCPGQLVSS